VSAERGGDGSILELEMRYPVGILVAVLLVAAGWWFVQSTRSTVQARFEQYKSELKAQRDAGQLPREFRDVDIDNLQPSQVGVQVSSSEQTRLGIAEALSEHAYIFVALALVMCLAVVVVIDLLRGRKIS
jgi:hypothetical protein